MGRHKRIEISIRREAGSRRVTAVVRSNKTKKQISELGNAAQPADPATRYDHVQPIL